MGKTSWEPGLGWSCQEKGYPGWSLGATQEEPTPSGRGSHLTQHVPPSSCLRPACPLCPHPSPLPQFLESALNFLFLTVLQGM